MRWRASVPSCAWPERRLGGWLLARALGGPQSSPSATATRLPGGQADHRPLLRRGYPAPGPAQLGPLKSPVARFLHCARSRSKDAFKPHRPGEACWQHQAILTEDSASSGPSTVICRSKARSARRSRLLLRPARRVRTKPGYEPAANRAAARPLCLKLPDQNKDAFNGSARPDCPITSRSSTLNRSARIFDRSLDPDGTRTSSSR